MKLKNVARTVVGLATLAVAVPMTACTVGSDTDATSEDELTSKTVKGDWHLFPGGECLAAVQGFYPDKFPKDHAAVPVAGPGDYGSCAAHGACKIWADPDTRPSKDYWERIPNDGKHVPKLYDLIVFPPTAHNPYGHIASVDHVDGKNIFVMDSNYVAHHEKAPYPHTVSWPAYGWYRLKALDKNAKAEVSCFPGGYYCGGDGVPDGPHDDLFRCNSAGTGFSLYRTCTKGCEIRPQNDDKCN